MKAIILLMTLIVSSKVFAAEYVVGKSHIVLKPNNEVECAHCTETGFNLEIDDIQMKLNAILDAKEQCASEVDRVAEWVSWGFDTSNVYIDPVVESYTYLMQAKFECINP